MVSMTVPVSDPMFGVWQWRADSQTVARLRPALMEFGQVEDQPCRLGSPYWCEREQGLTCMPCAVRKLKTVLFGTAQTGADNG